jgi:hypothetical protein
MKVEVDSIVVKAAALHLEDYITHCSCTKMNALKMSAEVVRKLLEEAIKEK